MKFTTRQGDALAQHLASAGRKSACRFPEDTEYLGLARTRSNIQLYRLPDGTFRVTGYLTETVAGGSPVLSAAHISDQELSAIGISV